MQKLRTSLVAVFLAAASLAQTSSGLLTPDVKRVGMKLACLCGGCNNTVGDCPMIGCHYSAPAREKIAAMQKAGMDDKQIVDAFVSEQGLKALATPPTEGFSLVGWLMPFIAAGFGLIAVWMVIRRYMNLKPAPVTELDRAVLDKYHDQIEKEVSKLE
jgi:cytochrome c-type biogenesis protein CcmH/NrfF